MPVGVDAEADAHMDPVANTKTKANPKIRGAPALRWTLKEGFVSAGS
jgi:hypothetical protein